MIDDAAGALHLPALVVVEDAVEVMELPPAVRFLRSGRKLPVGFAEQAVFLDGDGAAPVQGGDPEVPHGLPAVHPHEEAHDDQEDYGGDGQGTAGALRRGGGNLGLGGLLGRFLFLPLFQLVEIVAFGIRPAGAAGVAGLGVVTVQGVAEGTVPVGIFADIFRLLFRQVFNVAPLVFLADFPFPDGFQVELHIAPGPAAGGAVDHISPDFLAAADRTVPITHYEISHQLAPLYISVCGS
jgi:hypothetical protein